MTKYFRWFSAMLIISAVVFSVSFQKKQKYISSVKTKEPFHENKSEALDALQFFSEAAAFPNKDIPPQAYHQAYSFYKKNFSNGMQFLSNPWQSIGPKNVGGRTLAIAIDPVDTSIVWLGSASGGLWKSTTGGIGVDAWSYIQTGFPVLGVSSIAIDPLNNNVMYIGTGETYSQGMTGTGIDYRTTRGTYGIGILKSVDGGTTWTQSLNWNYQQNRGIWDIVIIEKNTSIIYAATTEGVYKSSNAGASWTQVLNQKMVMDIELNPVDTNIIFAGVGNMSSPNKGLYRSSDSGSNWSIITSGLPTNTQQGRITISCYKKNPAIVYATVYDIFNTVGVYRSTNKGINWVKISNSPDVASYQGWYAKGLIVKPDDSSKVLLGGVSVFKYRTGGAGFTDIANFNFPTTMLHPDIHNIIVNPKDPEKVYVATDGGLFRCNVFGDTLFYDCNDGYTTTQLYIGSVSAFTSQTAITGAQDNYTLGYNGSPYWFGIIGGDGCYNAIDPNDDNIQYGAYQYLNVYKTTDAWQANYQQILGSAGNANDINNQAFLAPFILCPSNTDVIYAGSDSLFVSTDGGISFIPKGSISLFKTHILTIAVSSTSVDTLYFATAPDGTDAMQVFRSINGGNSFTNITGTLPNRFPRRMSVNPQNSKEVYIAYSGFGTGHIFKSSDAGNTWNDIGTALPDVPFHVVTIDPQNPSFIYAGSDLGIFYSLDAGANWGSFNFGLPEALMVYDLVVSPSDRYLFAFTHGHGIYTAPMLEQANVGIKNNKLQGEIAIFPNPVSDILNVCLQDKNIGKTEVSVYSLTGDLLKNENIQAKNGLISLNISALAQGNYLINIQAANKSMSKRFTIVH